VIVENIEGDPEFPLVVFGLAGVIAFPPPPTVIG
jgi:hypothetical protein